MPGGRRQLCDRRTPRYALSRSQGYSQGRRHSSADEKRGIFISRPQHSRSFAGLHGASAADTAGARVEPDHLLSLLLRRIGAEALRGGSAACRELRDSRHRRIVVMPENSEEFYRIQKLPPYVFAVINEMRAKARAAQIDVIDLGMGNPDGSTPRIIVNKLIEAARNARNHRYSQSRGIPQAARGDRQALPDQLRRRARPRHGSDRHHRRQGRAGAPAVRHRRTRRRGRFAESRPIRSTSTACSWRRATPACCRCRTPPTFLGPPGGTLPDLFAASRRCF